MVNTPPSMIYLVKPQDTNHSDVGNYVITSYLSGGIIPDLRYRIGSGVTEYSTNNKNNNNNNNNNNKNHNNEQILQFKISKTSTFVSDPTLDFSQNGMNVLLWGHGGEWPVKHSISSRGFLNIYWKQRYCKSNTNNSNFIYIFCGCIGFLLLGGILFQFLIKNYYYNGLLYKYLFFTRLEDCQITFLQDFGSMSFGGFLMFLSYIIVIIILIIISGNYYMNNWEYKFTRAFGLSFGQFTLFCFGLITLPASKTSIWNKLLQIPYDRIIKYHRLFSYLTLILLLLHFSYELKTWSTHDILIFNFSHTIGKATISYGLLSGICFIILNLLSLSYIRNCK